MSSKKSLFVVLVEHLEKGNFDHFLKIKEERNFDINMVNYINESFLFKANDKAIDFLIANGIDVNITNSIQENALFYVKQASEIKKLVKAGISVNQTNIAGNNCLMHLASDKVFLVNKEMVKTLVKAGLDINQVNQKGENILFSMLSRPFIFEQCAKLGADHRLYNHIGSTIEDKIFDESQLKNIFEKLDEYKANREKELLTSILTETTVNKIERKRI